MPTLNLKAPEQRVRRQAERNGLALAKSRARNPEDYTYGTYGLVDPYLNAWVTSDPVGHGYGYSLADCIEFLDEMQD
ncbi:hypothetical protein FEZ32_07415 [Acidipropionibacterium jensenii]|uniref:hypothetical protein n=1 Tax=Acidipropionibacterium jensenii TaxID=1749 RepID=UPI00110A9C4B|nr:hypothetical protein [Acidipropionibacterium jensenii]QCV88203.1 hypothetical protein FEZ32_07415 [Acidipropionibacterium jensenii]